MDTLDRLLQSALAPGGFAVSGGRDLFMEVLDTTTGLYWLSTTPVTVEEFQNLSVEKPLVKVGIGMAPMDCAAFQTSPGDPGAAVLQQTIDGRLFINVAAIVQATPASSPEGPMDATVNKQHIIGFEAGRSVAIMSLEGEDYVELVGDTRRDSKLTLPEGASLRTIQLDEPLLIELPSPTRAFFWMNPMRSFQGPVKLPA